MPNRIIKETIRTSKKLNALTDFEFRLWTYLITYVDDFGRGSADPVLLKGFVLPRSPSTSDEISAALDRMETLGMIAKYAVDGEPYLYFPNWSEHQRVQCKKAKFPAPPENREVRKFPEATVALYASEDTESSPRCSTATGDALRCSTVASREENGNLRCSTVSREESSKVAEDRGASSCATETYGVSPCVTVGHGESPRVAVTLPPESESEYKSISEEKERVDREKKPPTATNAPRKSVFVPPSVEEVRAYIDSRGSRIDAERFVAYYETTDWHVGNRKMKDWRAAVRLWEKRDEERAAKETPRKEAPKKERQGTFDPEEAFRLALERTYGGEKK